MKGVHRRVKDHAAVKAGKDLGFTFGHAGVPKLELPAERLAPILVQIKQDVDPPIDLQIRMQVKVGMDLQEAAPFYLVQAAAPQVRIWDQAGDACKRLEKVEKHRRVELV